MKIPVRWQTLGGTVLFWFATLGAAGGVAIAAAAGNIEGVSYLVGRWLGTVAIVFILQGAYLKLRGSSSDAGDEPAAS